jgi:hypothetical protein
VDSDDMEGSAVSIKAPSTGAPGLSSSANLASSTSSGTATGPGPIFYREFFDLPSRYSVNTTHC